LKDLRWNIPNAAEDSGCYRRSWEGSGWNSKLGLFWPNPLAPSGAVQGRTGYNSTLRI